MTDQERIEAHERIAAICEAALKLLTEIQAQFAEMRLEREAEHRKTIARRKILYQRLMFLSGATASTNTASAPDSIYGGSYHDT